MSDLKTKKYNIYIVLSLVLVILASFLFPTLSPLKTKAAGGDAWYDSATSSYYLRVRNNINNEVVIINPSTITNVSGEKNLNFYYDDLYSLFEIEGYTFDDITTNMTINTHGAFYNTGSSLGWDNVYLTVNLKIGSSIPPIVEGEFLFEYLVKYKNTPFFIKEYKTIERNDDLIGDEAAILAALELDTLDIVVGPNVTVSFKKWEMYGMFTGKYFSAVYDTMKFNTIDYDGNITRWDLPIISYSSYLQTTVVAPSGYERTVGSWNDDITNLNGGAKVWFDEDEGIDSSSLFGYFFVAGFNMTKPKLAQFRSLLNYFFVSNTFKGTIIFDTREVVYMTSPLFFIGVGNRTYVYYFLYLDGTSADSYMSQNNAANSEDNTPAFQNSDLYNNFKDFFDKLFKNSKKIIYGAITVVVGVLVLGIVLNITKRKNK